MNHNASMHSIDSKTSKTSKTSKDEPIFKRLACHLVTPQSTIDIYWDDGKIIIEFDDKRTITIDSNTMGFCGYPDDYPLYDSIEYVDLAQVFEFLGFDVDQITIKNLQTYEIGYEFDFPIRVTRDVQAFLK